VIAIPEWTEEEIEILKKYYPKERAKQIAKRMDKSAPAIHAKANRIGVRKRQGWSHNPKPELVLGWRDTYTELYPKACEMHEAGIPLQVRTKFVSKGCYKFALFKLNPRNVKLYWNNC